MHRYTEHNNIVYNDNNYISVIPRVKRSLCILYCISSILHLPLNKAASIPAYIFIMI